MSVTFLFCFIFFSFLCFAPLLSSEAYEKWILFGFCVLLHFYPAKLMKSGFYLVSVFYSTFLKVDSMFITSSNSLVIWVAWIFTTSSSFSIWTA